jgi:hypothetical protein
MLVCYQAFLMGGLVLLAAVAECIGRGSVAKFANGFPLGA